MSDMQAIPLAKVPKPMSAAETVRQREHRAGWVYAVVMFTIIGAFTFAVTGSGMLVVALGALCTAAAAFASVRVFLTRDG